MRFGLYAAAGNPPGAGNSHPREREVFDLLVKGDSVKEIAFKLELSHKTVHVHRANVLGKLNCHSTIELVHFALDHHLLAGH